MSWEGYAQMLCKNGHLREHDEGFCYADHSKCPSCDAEVIGFAIIDTTNGCDQANQTVYDSSMDAYESSDGIHHEELCTSCSSKLKLEVLSHPEKHTCNVCNQEHTIGETLYKLKV